MTERKRHIREMTVLFAGAFLYAFLYAFCSQIDESGATVAGVALPRFAAAFPIALIVLFVLLRWALPRLEMAPDGSGKPFCAWGACAFIFFCYIPMFLVHYPGSFQYDSAQEVAQIAGNDYNQMHPILHTLLVKLCISFYDLFQSMEKCAALLNLIQMAMVSICFALVCASLARSVSRRAARVSAVFFGLYPAHWAFASNCTKDVLFASFLALFFALCMEEIRLEGLTHGRRILMGICGVLALLLRNNIIFALVPWALVLVFRGKAFRRMALYTILIVLSGQGINAGLAAMMNAEGGRLTEGLSLPIQQMARTRIYAPDCITAEETALMDELFVPEEMRGDPEAHYAMYNPMLADPIKNNVDHELMTERLPEFAKLWADVGVKASRVYWDAFLNLALPSLYPYGEYKLDVRYIEVGCNLAMTAHYSLAPIVQPRRFAPVRAWLDETFFLNGADDNPVLRWLFNTGFVYWVMILFVLYDMYRGNRGRVAVLLLPVFFWFTYLLGPVMQGRYLYPFICMLPVIMLRSAEQAIQGSES